jgi:hypothetical protein
MYVKYLLIVIALLASQVTDANEGGATLKHVHPRSRDVLSALQKRDINALALLIHPQKGVRFTPYGFVGEVDRVVMRNELVSLWNSNTRYFWGLYDATGKPIRRTFKDYFKRFVYDRDYASTKRIAVGEIQKTNKYINVFERYPGAVVLDYLYTGDVDFAELDWRSLRLVMEEFEDVWYLVGVIHDEWTQSSTED